MNDPKVQDRGYDERPKHPYPKQASVDVKKADNKPEKLITVLVIFVIAILITTGLDMLSQYFQFDNETVKTSIDYIKEVSMLALGYVGGKKT